MECKISFQCIENQDKLAKLQSENEQLKADKAKLVKALDLIYKVECKEQACSIASRAIARQCLAEIKV